MTYPRSTCLPAKIRDMPIPAAITVKKKPDAAVIPISLAYIATKFVVAPYGMDSSKSEKLTGIPFISINLSSDIGGRFVCGLTFVFIMEARTSPVMLAVYPTRKICSYGILPCMNSPVMGPRAIAELLVRP